MNTKEHTEPHITTSIFCPQRRLWSLELSPKIQQIRSYTQTPMSLVLLLTGFFASQMFTQSSGYRGAYSNLALCTMNTQTPIRQSLLFMSKVLKLCAVAINGTARGELLCLVTVLYYIGILQKKKLITCPIERKTSDTVLSTFKVNMVSKRGGK